MSRLLYIGNFEPEFSTENEVRKAFEHLGWEVIGVQEAEAIEALGDHFGAKGIQAVARECDLVLYTMTQGIGSTDAEALWRYCADQGVPTACFHLDLFYGLKSPKGSASIPRDECPARHPMFRTEYAFTADGGHQAEFERDGVNHHWLPPGVSHEAHPLEPTDASRAAWQNYDVAFVGSGAGYHAEWLHRQRLIEHLASWYGDRFLHVKGGLRGDDLALLYATVPVIVGDSCFASTDALYWSDRFTEAWARGAFLIHPQIDALETLIGSRYPSWEVGDWDALHEEIAFYLPEPELRENWRDVHGIEVRHHHTYVQRVEQMLLTMGLT